MKLKLNKKGGLESYSVAQLFYVTLYKMTTLKQNNVTSQCVPGRRVFDILFSTFVESYLRMFV